MRKRTTTPRADLDHDGDIDSDDEARFCSSFDRFGGLMGNWTDHLRTREDSVTLM